jgi:hypothetical protein
LSTLKLAHRLTYSAIIIWILYDCLFLIFYDLQPTAGCAIYNIYFGYFFAYIHLILLNAIIPPFTESLFSILAYLNVRRIIQLRMQVFRRKLERQLTAMVLAKAAFTVAMAVPGTLIRIYLLNVTVSPNDSLRLAIHQLLSIISYAGFYANTAVCSLT